MHLLQETQFLSFILIVVGAMGAHIMLHSAQKKWLPWLTGNGYCWSAAAVKMVTRPGIALTWYIAFVSIITYRYPVETRGYFLKVGVIASLLYALTLLLKEVEVALVAKKRIDGTTAGLFSKLSAVLLALVSLLLLLPMVGIDVGGLLAFGGFSGIAVGLAAKDSLSHLLGGFAIAIDKPFRSGDWVYSAEGKLEGIVEHIGWRMTRLRTLDKRALFIPNSYLSNLTLINASLMTHQKIVLTIPLASRHFDKVEKATLALRQYLKMHSQIDIRELHTVHVTKVDVTGLELYLSAYTRVTDKKAFYELNHSVLLDTLRILEEHDVALSTPSLLLTREEGFSLTSSPL